mmetsp:Transcript_16975/g.54859  ORF Transcript_16975/g.54859 Transcript_16975/m.54859 type:complete len:236 (-) Transcript_16975:272-979(-)
MMRRALLTASASALSSCGGVSRCGFSSWSAFGGLFPCRPLGEPPTASKRAPGPARLRQNSTDQASAESSALVRGRSWRAKLRAKYVSADAAQPLRAGSGCGPCSSAWACNFSTKPTQASNQPNSPRPHVCRACSTNHSRWAEGRERKTITSTSIEESIAYAKVCKGCSASARASDCWASPAAHCLVLCSPRPRHLRHRAATRRRQKRRPPSASAATVNLHVWLGDHAEPAQPALA